LGLGSFSFCLFDKYVIHNQSSNYCTKYWSCPIHPMIVPVPRYDCRSQSSCWIDTCTGQRYTYQMYQKNHATNCKTIHSCWCLFVDCCHENYCNQEEGQNCFNSYT